MGQSGSPNRAEVSRSSPQAFLHHRGRILTTRTKYDAAVFVLIAGALTVALSMGGVSTAPSLPPPTQEPDDVTGLVASFRQLPGDGGFGTRERERLVVVETEVKQIRTDLAQIREQLKFHLDPFSILLLLVVGGEKGWAVIKALKGDHK